MTAKPLACLWKGALVGAFAVAYLVILSALMP